MVFRKATAATLANAKTSRLIDINPGGRYCSFRLIDLNRDWLLQGMARNADGLLYTWRTPIPRNLDTALLRSWAAGDCPSYALADWLEESGLEVPADVLAMLREPQEN